MKQGAQTLADAHEDKYDRVLSIFKYGDLNQAKAVFPDMDEAIKKASVAITRHSINVKGKHDSRVAERNKWIDDCWLVIGKSQFYKHDYWSSIETFQYASNEYKEMDSRPEALLWLTKSYLELGKTVDAEYLLDFLKADKKFPVELKGLYNATLAQYHLIKNDIPRAIEALEAASATAKKRDDRARYTFILGQLLQKQGDLNKAYTVYDRVIKLHPPYEMALYARFNRASCYDISSGNAEAVKKELNKMLKDEKNKEYRDRIYFALAGIARRENQEEKAIEYLNLSLHSGPSENTQKASGYMVLGDIYLKRPEYIPAAAYYDSCLTNLGTDHPDYLDVQAKRNSLDRLVKNLKVIMQEDSLQTLSKMTQSEREAMVDKVISRENEEKERLKIEQEEAQKLEEQAVLEEKDLKSQPKNLTQPATAQGSWYFYNQAAMSFGFNEFLKKWGTRKLEDDWRRSDKELIVAGNNELEEVDSSLATPGLNTDSISKLESTARKEAYLKMIPSSETAIKESNIRITEAYYNVGVIYREQLNNLPESVKSFETLDQRYPENKYKQPSYYNLYRTWATLGDSVKSDYYKNYLLANYPESEYSKLILNPNYFKELKKKTAVLEVFYENTYRAYENRQYAEVIERKLDAETMYPGNKLMPKFTLLKAMAIGKTKTLPEFELALEEVVRNYPKDTAATRAKEILDYIHGTSITSTVIDTGKATEIQEEIDNSVKFVKANDQPQMFLVLSKKGAINTAELIGKLNSYNNRDHTDENLEVVNGNIDLQYQYILIKSFADKNASMVYYEQIMEEAGLLTEFDPASVQFYSITQENLTELVRSKNYPAYSQFFQKNYLQ
ncbi:hypothetical protein BH11BAC2_BH11BAC2_01540 [soil metagenome]